MTRDELNEKARSLGIENPEELPSSAAVKAAIKAHLSDEPDDADEPAADDEPTTEATAFDVIGADGRKIIRHVSRDYAVQEAARISALTGEEIKVVEAAPFQYLS